VAVIQSRYSVVIGAFMVQCMVIGSFFAYGVLIKEFETEFGWSRTLLSGVSALATLMMGVLASVAGRMADRYGPRRVLLVTGPLFAIGLVLISTIGAPWQLYLLFGTLIAAGLGSHDVVTLSTVARWFEARRGIMSGVVKLGTALGQAAVPPIMALLIVAQGWRGAVVTLGLVAAVVLVIAALLMSHPPKAPGVAGADAAEGMSFAEARATRTFWTLCAIQFLFFASVMSVPVHIAVHGMDLGLSKASAALLLSVLGGSSAAGRLAVGFLVDGAGGRLTMIFILTVLAVSMSALVVVSSTTLLFAVMAVYGFAHGGLFTVVSPTVAGFFGRRAHGSLFGIVLLSGTVGGAFGPILTGYLFDTTGSYAPAFTGLAGLAFAAVALAVTLPRRAA
jgi:MFS family permease